jgi:AhpC/TSA family
MKRAFLVLGAVASVTLAPFAAKAQAQSATAAAAQKPPAPPPPSVKVGEPMPEFTLNYLEPAPDGGRPSPRTVTLSELKGSVVVLAFFPAAFSPG